MLNTDTMTLIGDASHIPHSFTTCHAVNAAPAPFREGIYDTQIAFHYQIIIYAFSLL
jgi:hypothetical protein